MLASSCLVLPYLRGRKILSLIFGNNGQGKKKKKKRTRQNTQLAVDEVEYEGAETAGIAGFYC